MPRGFKADWKSAKKNLTQGETKLKIGRDARFKSYVGHRKQISTLFDKLDIALEGEKLKTALNLWKELKGKVSGWITVAKNLQREFKSGKEYDMLKEAVVAVQSLMVVCRSEVTELKDKIKAKEASAKKQTEWTKKLDEMNDTLTVYVGKINNIAVSIGGLKSEFGKLKTKLVPLEDIESNADARFKMVLKLNEKFKNPEKELKGRLQLFDKVESQSIKLVNAIEKYMKRPGMDTSTREWSTATDLTSMVPGDLAQAKQDLQELLELADEIQQKIQQLIVKANS